LLYSRYYSFFNYKNILHHNKITLNEYRVVVDDLVSSQIAEHFDLNMTQVLRLKTYSTPTQSLCTGETCLLFIVLND